MLWWIDPLIAAYFPIWLAGTAISLLCRSRQASTGRHPWRVGAATLLLAAVMVAVHTSTLRHLPLIFRDALVALVFAGLVYVLVVDLGPAGRYQELARRLSGCSYTLYVVHLPFLVFLR